MFNLMYLSHNQFNGQPIHKMKWNKLFERIYMINRLFMYRTSPIIAPSILSKLCNCVIKPNVNDNQTVPIRVRYIRFWVEQTYSTEDRKICVNETPKLSLYL